LRPRSFKPVDDIPDDTDIYDDLGINGGDLAEIFDWAAATYGADFSSVTPKTYDINEPPGRWFSTTSFKPVTIKEMLDAIERGHWIVPP
jgi:hypothetical protein